MNKVKQVWISVHSAKPAIDADDPHAHAFGPFAGVVELMAFEDETPDDGCYRFMLPMLLPPDAVVVTIDPERDRVS